MGSSHFLVFRKIFASQINVVYIYTVTNKTIRIMERYTISVTPDNDTWLKKQIKKETHASKAELINDLIRTERNKQEELKWLRSALIAGEESGVSDRSPEDLMAAIRKNYAEKTNEGDLQQTS
jgi:antitoxin ParD1/3/4